MSVHKDGRSSCGTQQYWRARPAKGGPSKGKFPSHEAGAAWLAVGRGRTAATALGQLTWSANQPSLAGWAEAARVGCPLRALGRNSCSRRRWAAMQASTTSASRRLRRLGPQRPRAHHGKKCGFCHAKFTEFGRRFLERGKCGWGDFTNEQREHISEISKAARSMDAPDGHLLRPAHRGGAPGKGKKRVNKEWGRG